MLWDLVLAPLRSMFATPRNQGVLALAVALIAGGFAAKIVGSRALGAVVAVLLGLMWWPKISVAAGEVFATVTTVQTTVTGESHSFTGLRCGGVEPVLSTIRKVESGNQYDRMNGSAHTGATASGAYQYTNGTWNNYGGYKRAKDAPPDLQDERARGDVTRFLERHNGDVSLIPVLWYIGHVPSAGEWDAVPWASQGNTLTPRQYQRKWLAEYERQTAACGEVE